MSEDNKKTSDTGADKDEFDPLAEFDLEELGLDDEEDDIRAEIAADIAKEEQGEDAETTADTEEPAADTASADVIAELTEQIQKLTATNQSLMRQLNEAKKAKTRAESNTEKEKERALDKFAMELLDVADTLELASKFMDPEDRKTDPKLDALAKGVEMTEVQLADAFNKFEIKKIEALGAEFDENKHMAVRMVKDSGEEPGTVVQVAKSGYTIKDRTLRPAMVGVAK